MMRSTWLPGSCSKRENGLSHFVFDRVRPGNFGKSGRPAMGEAWRGAGMDPYLPLESSWPSLTGTGVLGLQAGHQQLSGSSFNSSGLGQTAGPGSLPLPELDNDFIDCLLANLQVPMLPPQQQQHQQQSVPQYVRPPESHQLQHLQMPQSAPSSATLPEPERADHESEAGIAMPSSDDRDAPPMIARLKERNRKAQRAFRARQKAGAPGFGCNQHPKHQRKCCPSQIEADALVLGRKSRVRCPSVSRSCLTS